MEKVFARVSFSSRLSVCSSPHLAKPFPVICYASQTERIKQKSKTTKKNKKNTPDAKFILFPSHFFANAHQHICKKPKLNQQLILQKS